MSPLCDCCGEHIHKLNQQVSVMRKEIKNLRQMLSSAIRAQRKHMTSVQAAVSKIRLCEADKDLTHSLPSPSSPQAALEKGNIQTVPIGYISSCFSMKNGTPRQPTICGPSKAELQIQQSVFNNPEHALVGLDQYSHVWIIFLFHKNGHLSYKAKVRPPRLNGQKVGVYSTRSPHRPNALGLTLAKLDRIEGDTVHLSDIDMIAGTPVLDIKPYIPEYDCPDTRMSMLSEPYDSNATAVSLNEETNIFNPHKDSEAQLNIKDEREDDDESPLSKVRSETDVSFTNLSGASAQFSLPEDFCSVLEEVQTYVTQDDISQISCESKNQVSDSTETRSSVLRAGHPCYGAEAYTTIAGWIREPPVASLDVRFTPHAERELAEFLPAHLSAPPSWDVRKTCELQDPSLWWTVNDVGVTEGERTRESKRPSESDRPRFQFLCSPEEAATAIRGVLSADPRSVYRRTRCRDRLFFFTLDTADITCWFGQGFAEVLQVRPVERHIA